MHSVSATPTQGYWDGLRISLLRFYEGPPIGRHGVFQGVVFTAYHLLKGEVIVAKNGVSVHARAGQWVVCHPGERFQDFSDSSRILSIHLLIENPANEAGWIGCPVVALDADRELNRCALRMQRAGIPRRQRECGKLTPQAIPSTFAEQVELQEVTAAFTGRLLALLEPSGMRYEPSPIRDARVRESRRRLATMSLREPFARAALAKTCGLSPAHLDRLWRTELATTPAQYWNRRRLEAACALLQGDGHSIKEVAYELGFDHPSQFSFWFAKNMNEPPRKFRSRHERD